MTATNASPATGSADTASVRPRVAANDAAPSASEIDAVLRVMAQLPALPQSSARAEAILGLFR